MDFPLLQSKSKKVVEFVGDRPLGHAEVDNLEHHEHYEVTAAPSPRLDVLRLSQVAVAMAAPQPVETVSYHPTLQTEPAETDVIGGLRG